MKIKNSTVRALITILTLSISLIKGANAASYTYNLGADNDFALYTANGIGFAISDMTLQVDNTSSWETANAGTYSTDADYIYIWARNYNGSGNVAGKINGIDIATVAWERTDDLILKITGPTWPETITPDLSNITILSATETFSGPAPIYTGTSGVSPSLGVSQGLDLSVQSEHRIFRTQAVNFVPEPSSTLLLGLGGMGLILRRKRVS